MSSDATKKNQAQTAQVIVVRRDLQMKGGKLAAQCCHASLSALRAAERSKDMQFRSAARVWETEEGQTKVVLRADTEEEMLKIYQAALAAGLPTALITDSGFTAFHGVPTNTTLGIGPALRSQLDAITGHLSLL